MGLAKFAGIRNMLKKIIINIKKYMKYSFKAAFVFLLIFVIFRVSFIYSAEPSPPQYPAGISDLTALTGVYEGDVILTWTAPGDDGSKADPPVSGYSIRYYEGQITRTGYNDYEKVKIYNSIWTDFVAGGSVETRVLTGLSEYCGRKLYFALKGYDEVPNYGIWNSSSDVGGLEINLYNSCIVKLIPPSPVNNLTVSAGYKNAILSWTSPGDDGNSGNIINGAIEIRCSPTNPITSETDWNSVSSGYPYRAVVSSSMIAGSLQRYTLTGLAIGSTYYFAIKIKDENESGWSNIDITIPKPVSSPINAPPVAFGLSSPANSIISATEKPSFSWENSTDPDNSGIYSYGLQISEYSNFSSFVQAPIGIAYSSYTLIEAIPDDKTYYWRAKAIDVDGGVTYSNESRILYVNTSNASPVNFSLTSPKNETVLKKPTFVWSASQDPDPPWTVKYTIYYSTYSDFASYQTITNLSTTTYTFISNLTENTTYYWKVAASDEYIVPSSIFSTEIYSFYVRPVLPAAPAGIKMTNNSITWDSVLLDEDGVSITDFSKYKIYRSSDIKILGTSGTFAEDTTQNSTLAISGYWTAIRAVDVYGNESANSMSINPDETKQIMISNTRDLIIEIPTEAQISLTGKIISISKSGNIYDIKPLNISNMNEIYNFEFSSPVKITFETNGDCVYWFNGIEYVALGGRIGNSITVQTKKLGRFYTGSIGSYKLKLVSSFPTKIFTPNGDGINDEINLTFSGITEESINAQIFDMSGKKVSDMTQRDFSWFLWDGKDSDGKVVLPGIYIYQVKNGKYTANGTVVVAR